MSGRIVVLGMHRSGTSCVGELLVAMGAYLGPRGMGTTGTVDNPHGPFERRDLRRLCHLMLKQARADWWATSRLSADRMPGQIGARIADMLAPMLADLNAHEPWFIKEPRLCILLPMLRAQLGPVVAVCVWRDPLEVAQSLQTRDAMPLEFGIALWERYVRASFGAGVPRVMVSYNRLVADPEGVTRTLLDELTALGVGGLRMPGPAELARAIDPGLRRNAPRIDAASMLTPSQGRLLAALQAGDPNAAELAAPLSPGQLAQLGRFEKARRRQMKAAAYRSLAEARDIRAPLAMRMRDALKYVPLNPVQWIEWSRQGKLGRRLRQHLDAATIAFGGGFDAQWYRQKYRDLAGADPLMHFVRYGASEGRDPSPSHPTSRNLRAALEQATAR